MKLDLINKIKESFHHDLVNNKVTPDSLPRLCIKKWQEHFDIEEMYQSSILKLALKNESSGRLWGGESNSIKSGLIQLAEHNPDLFWTALKDLFNEDRMIIMKANRFIHHCDVIFADLKKSNDKLISHHQDYYSATLLLSLQYPASYCLFNFDVFSKFCKDIGVLNLPVDSDLERYYKIINAISKIISRDDSFMETYYSKLEENIYLGPALDIVYDMMTYNEVV